MVSTDRDDRSCTMSTAGPMVPHTTPAAQRKIKPDQPGLPVLWSVGVDVTRCILAACLIVPSPASVDVA